MAARHGIRQATRGTIINYASLPLIFMGGWTVYAIQEAASLAIPLGFLTFSRGFEKEADMLGLPEDSNRPRLRRSPGNRRVDDQNGGKEADKDERPTLKRRDNYARVLRSRAVTNA